MIERGKGGAIVMMSSIAGMKGIGYHSIYCTTKGALDQLTRCLALELGPHKVLLVCVDALHPSQHFFSHVGKFSSVGPISISCQDIFLSWVDKVSC